MTTRRPFPARLRTRPTTDMTADTVRCERFWAKVAKGPDCWEWSAARARFGHGLFWTGVRIEQAHRLAWVMANGPIPDGLGVLHTCDNPPCVNPAHLFVGTQQANVVDMLAKGRGRYQKAA